MKIRCLPWELAPTWGVIDYPKEPSHYRPAKNGSGIKPTAMQKQKAKEPHSHAVANHELQLQFREILLKIQQNTANNESSGCACVGLNDFWPNEFATQRIIQLTAAFKLKLVGISSGSMIRGLSPFGQESTILDEIF